jgi:hypothetical protein
MFVSCFYFFYSYFVYLHFFLFYVFMYLFIFYYLFQKDFSFFNMFYNENNFLKNCIFVWLDASPPVFLKDFFNKNGTLPDPPLRLPWPPCPCPVCHHRERTGRIFQARPIIVHTDRHHVCFNIQDPCSIYE